MAAKNGIPPLNTLKECLQFLEWLKKRKKLEDVAGELNKYLNDKYNDKVSVQQIKSALQTFLGHVSAFYSRLCVSATPGNYSSLTAQQVSVALLQYLPKFLAAMYYLWYDVNATFAEIGGGGWKENWLGYDSGSRWGGDLATYLHEKSVSTNYGGMIPGGFSYGDVKYGYYDSSGYKQGWNMALDLQTLLDKNFRLYNAFRDVLATSVFSVAGIHKENTGNAVALVGTFCQIVAAAEERAPGGGMFKKELDGDLESGKCINWNKLKNHCSNLQKHFNNLFTKEAFSHSGQSLELRKIKTDKFAKETAKWLRTNLPQVRRNLLIINTRDPVIDTPKKEKLGEYFTKNLFPYGFVFDDDHFRRMIRYRKELLQKHWRDVIDEFVKQGNGLERLREILEGEDCPDPPKAPSEALSPNAKGSGTSVTTGGGGGQKGGTPGKTTPGSSSTGTSKGSATKTAAKKSEAAKPTAATTATPSPGGNTNGTPNQGTKAKGANNQGSRNQGASNQNNGRSGAKPSSSSVATSPSSPSPGGTRAPGPARPAGDKGSKGSPSTQPTKSPGQNNIPQKTQSPSQSATHPGNPAGAVSTSQPGDGGGSKNGGGDVGRKAGGSPPTGHTQAPSGTTPGPPSLGASGSSGGTGSISVSGPQARNGRGSKGGGNEGSQTVAPPTTASTLPPSIPSPVPASSVIRSTGGGSAPASPGSSGQPGDTGPTSVPSPPSVQSTSQSSTSATGTTSSGSGAGAGGGGVPAVQEKLSTRTQTYYDDLNNRITQRRNAMDSIIKKAQDQLDQINQKQFARKLQVENDSKRIQHGTNAFTIPSKSPSSPRVHPAPGRQYYNPQGRSRQHGDVSGLDGRSMPDEPLSGHLASMIQGTTPVDGHSIVDERHKQEDEILRKQRHHASALLQAKRQSQLAEILEKDTKIEEDRQRQVKAMQTVLQNHNPSSIKDAENAYVSGNPINLNNRKFELTGPIFHIPTIVGNPLPDTDVVSRRHETKRKAQDALKRIYQHRKDKDEELHDIKNLTYRLEKLGGGMVDISRPIPPISLEIVEPAKEDSDSHDDKPLNPVNPVQDKQVYRDPYYNVIDDKLEITTVARSNDQSYNSDFTPADLSFDFAHNDALAAPTFTPLPPDVSLQITKPPKGNADIVNQGAYEAVSQPFSIQVPDRTLQDSSYDLDIHDPPIPSLQPLDPLGPVTTAVSLNIDPIDPPQSLPNRYVTPYMHDAQTVGMCTAPWMTQTETGDSTDIPETELFPSQAPRTVREMLTWLAGLRNEKHHKTLEKCINKAFGGLQDDSSQLALFINHAKIRPGDVFDILQLTAMFADSVLTAIEPNWKANVSSRFVKPKSSDQSDEPDCCALLCQLRDYVYACCYQLEYLKAQCNRDKSLGGWKSHDYGNAVSPSASPLQASLTDGWDSTFETHFFDPCNLCHKSRVRMGFKKEDLPKKSEAGTTLSSILTPSCGGSDPLLTLCSYLNCLTRRTPRTTGELVSFFHHFGNSLHDVYSNELLSLGSSLTKSHADCPGWDHLGGADLNAVRGIRGSESINSKHNSSHDNNHARTLSTLVGCGSDPANCHPHCSPITYRAYALYSQSFVHTYLSWTVYLPDRLHESLEKLYYDLQKHRGSSKCSSLYSCTKAMPLLYLHGFTPPEGTSQPKLTCSQVTSKLKEIVNGKPIASLMTAMDDFLYGIREPFIFTLVALWSLAFLIFANTMLYRLDVLYIRSHLIRTKASHVIDVKALLSDNKKMMSLYDANYFDDDPNELLNLR